MPEQTFIYKKGAKATLHSYFERNDLLTFNVCLSRDSLLLRLGSKTVSNAEYCLNVAPIFRC